MRQQTRGAMDEWLRSLDEKLGLVAEPMNPGEFTTAMYATAIGCSEKSARRKITLGISRGLIEHVGRKRVACDKRICPVPVYRVFLRKKT
jgi:hypothetical protein